MLCAREKEKGRKGGTGADCGFPQLLKEAFPAVSSCLARRGEEGKEREEGDFLPHSSCSISARAFPKCTDYLVFGLSCWRGRGKKREGGKEKRESRTNLPSKTRWKRPVLAQVFGGKVPPVLSSSKERDPCGGAYLLLDKRGGGGEER